MTRTSRPGVCTGRRGGGVHGPRPRVWLWWPGMRLLRSLSNSMEAMETLSPSMPALASPSRLRLLTGFEDLLSRHDGDEIPLLFSNVSPWKVTLSFPRVDRLAAV